MKFISTYLRLQDCVSRRNQQHYHFKDVKEIRDIVYSQSAPKVCKLDVYKKVSEKPLPTILYFHGDGFVAGSKNSRKNYSRYMAEQNFIVINIDYGLAPKYYFPDPIKHAQQALKWVEFNAEKYGVDIDNIFLAGDSAGAYIALALYLSCHNDTFRTQIGGINTYLEVQAMAFHSGIFDPEKLLEVKLPFNLTTRLASEIFRFAKTQNIQRTPYYNIINLTKLVDEKCPPTFVSYTSFDDKHPQQSAQLVTQIYNKGVPIWVLKAIEHKAPRNWQILKTDNYALACLTQVTEFFNAVADENINSKYTEI